MGAHQRGLVADHGGEGQHRGVSYTLHQKAIIAVDCRGAQEGAESTTYQIGVSEQQKGQYSWGNDGIQGLRVLQNAEPEGEHHGGSGAGLRAAGLLPQHGEDHLRVEQCQLAQTLRKYSPGPLLHRSPP